MIPDSAEHRRRVAAIVDAVLAYEPADRAGYLDIVCAGHDSLRARVEECLANASRPGLLDARAADFASPLLTPEDLIAERVPSALDIASATTQPLDMPYAAAAAKPPVMTESLPNEFGDRYLPRRRLGRGGMATVYLATDTKHDRPVAVKVLNEELTARVGAQRFVQEIRLTARLQHPHVLALLDSGVFGSGAGALVGRPYYVMPYVEGESLRSRLEAADPLSVAEALRVLRDVADALRYAHAQGVVHRDIKPENILLSGEHAVIADFGIAKALFDSQKETPPSGVAIDVAPSLTKLTSLVGTPAYMAPEQADSTMRVDQRADIYAWGVVAYELLVGRHPFAESANAREFVVAHVSEMPPPLRRKHRLIDATRGEKPQPLGIVASDVPSALVKLVMRCLEKDPARRPQEASELLEVLEDANATILARHRQRALRSRSLVVAAAVLVTALLVTGALSSRTLTVGRRSTRDTAAYAAVDRGLRIWGRSTDQPAFAREQALREFESAYRLDSTYADAFAHAADLLLDMAHSTASLALYDSAGTLARHALALDPGQVKAVNVLSAVELAHDRPADALPVIERAVREHPSSPTLLALLGHTRQLFGDSAAAWNAVTRALALAPRSEPILTNAFDVALALHRYADARSILSRRLAADPGDIGTLRASGWLAAAVGDSVGVALAVHEYRARGGLVRAGPMLILVRRADASLEQELATASPDTYGAASAADSASFFTEKAKLFMTWHDTVRSRLLVDSAYAIVVRLAAAPTSVPEWKRQRWRDLAWLAAARGDRSVALAALARGATSPRIALQPGSTIDAEQTCASAEVHALLHDTEPMLTALRRCLAMPNGADPSELTEPVFQRYAGDPRFRALFSPGAP